MDAPVGRLEIFFEIFWSGKRELKCSELGVNSRFFMLWAEVQAVDPLHPFRKVMKTLRKNSNISL